MPIARALLIGAMLAAALPATTLAQSAAEPSLKAAFLYNFAKFAEWPTDALAPGSPLVLCVVGDDVVSDALSDIVKGRKADGMEIAVRRLRADGPVQACHLLYVANGDLARWNGLLSNLKGMPILTVGDVKGFAEAGGVARLFEEDGKMRFAINTKAADRSRLRLSSKLLSLARLVKEDAYAGQP